MVKTKSKGRNLKKNPIGFKTWKNGKKYVEFRKPDGTLVQQRQVTGKLRLMTLKDFKEIFKQNNTFYENRKRTLLGGKKDSFYENSWTSERGKNIEYDFAKKKKIEDKLENNLSITKAEREYLKSNPIDAKPILKPRSGQVIDKKTKEKRRATSIYVVSGVFRGKRYYGRSTKIGVEVAGVKVETSAQAKQLAWENLKGVIAYQSEGHNSGDTVFGEEMIEKYGITNIREEWVFYN